MVGAKVIPRALLLSGGMDSSALAWQTRPDLAITIDYGQLAARGEIRAAAAVCESIGIRHRVLIINCRELGSGDMAGTHPASAAPVPEWWPFRNQLIITMAAAIALTEGMKCILVGSVANDAAHADGRVVFFEAMNRVLIVQEGALELQAPALGQTAIDLCRHSGIPFEVLAWTHSCHVSEYACGACRGCVKHRETMHALGYGEY